MDKIIASKGLTNNHGLAVWNLNDYEIVVSLNYGTKRTYKLYYNTKGVYFNYKGSRHYLDEFIRTAAI